MKEVVVTLRFSVPDHWKFSDTIEVVTEIAKAAKVAAEDVDVVNVNIDNADEGDEL